MRVSPWIPRALVALAAAALTLTMTATVLASSPPSHAGRPLGATLTGAAEVPPADPDGTGAASIWVNDGHRRVCWQLTVSNIILPATAAHIHVGAVDVAGGIVVPLSAPDATGRAQGCTSVTRALAKSLIQHPERYYVNVHSTEFPGGAIRGRLHKGHGTAPASTATGLKIVKVVDGNTTGWTGGTFTFTATCGAVVMTPSINLGSGVTTGSTTLPGLTAGTLCTVVELPAPPPGANALWTGTAINPVTPVTLFAGSRL